MKTNLGLTNDNEYLTHEFSQITNMCEYKKIIFIFFLSLLFFQWNYAYADQVGISVDQSIFSFSADAGTLQEIKLNVRNTSEKMQKMSLQVVDFVAGDNGKITSVAARNEQFGMKEWVSAKEPNWVLEPKASKEVVLTINIPKNAAVGAHYALANIRAFPEVDGQNFQNTLVGGQVGVYLLINVSGAISGSGDLKNFDVPVVAPKDVPLKAEFENTGNILYIPHGEIKIQNLLTREISIVDSEKHFVFPNTKYLFEMQWSPGSILGAYSAQATFIDANGVAHAEQRFFFGKLFFIIPLVLILIGIFAALMIRRNRENKKLKIC